MRYIETYSKLKENKSDTFRQRMRNILIEPISKIYNVLNDADRLLTTPRIQFLYIHHTFKDEERAFARLLEYLSRHHQFISHSEAVKRILNEEIDKPFISFSFDDGLKNNLKAAEILESFGARGCFFVCPEIVGESDEQKIADFSKARLHFPPVEFMTWQEIDGLLEAGHEIGGHTMNHVNLASVNKEEAEDEIRKCYSEILGHCGSVKHFAYPYGRFDHFDLKSRKIVFDAGFESCASAERGCHIADPQSPKIDYKDLLIRRDHVLLNWSLEQIQFFLLRNIKNASIGNNFFPDYADSDSHK